MHQDQRQENVRLLASILGLPDEEAAARLNVPVQVSWTESDRSAGQLGRFVVALLQRTFDGVGFPEAPLPAARCELRINGAPSLVQGAIPLDAWIDLRGCWIRREATGRFALTSVSEDGVTEVPPILLLLCASFCAALVTNSAIGLSAGRDAPDGFAIDFAVWPGVPLSAFAEQVDVGPLHMVGAGAVGNAVLYALQHLSVFGWLVVIDPKPVTGGTINRCLWFTERDIGEPKAQCLANKVARAIPRLETTFFNGTLDAHRVAQGGEYKCLVVGVDSRRGRRLLQEEIPGEVFDSSTTGIEEVVFHHNVQPSGRACLACIYRETEEERSFETHVGETLNVSTVELAEGFISPAAAKRVVARYPKLRQEDIVGKAFDSLFKQLCATQQLVTPEQRQVLAPFAFVSQLAGTIAAIELFLRRRDPGRADAFNYWRVSPWRGINLDLQQLRARRPACPVCADDD